MSIPSGNPYRITGISPLVNVHKKRKLIIYNDMSHLTWWFYIVMWQLTRGYGCWCFIGGTPPIVIIWYFLMVPSQSNSQGGLLIQGWHYLWWFHILAGIFCYVQPYLRWRTLGLETAKPSCAIFSLTASPLANHFGEVAHNSQIECPKIHYGIFWLSIC